MAKMRTKKEIQQKLADLKAQLKALKEISKEGFSYPQERNTNKNSQKVHAVLIVGLEWVLGEKLNQDKLYDND